MKKFLLFIFLFNLTLSRANDLLIENPYSASFRKAYALNPTVPKGILEAVAFTQTRFEHLSGNREPSCIGYPTTYGIMGLVMDGKSYFRNNLLKVSELSGYSTGAIISSAENSVLAYAKAFSVLQQEKRIFSNNISDYNSILIALSELPVDDNQTNNFALNAHLYQIYWFLSSSQFQDLYGFPNHSINLEEIFKENYDVLHSRSITITKDQIKGDNGGLFVNNIQLAPDYPSAIYTPAAACNYSSRNGTAISGVTIHDIEGTYAGCISWFQNCAAGVSAHYVLRSSDGQITQMVLESAKAWHVGSENPYTVGLEHEGYNNNPIWYTNAMYNASGLLVRDICNDNSINKLRTYYGPGCSGTSQQCGLGACTKVKGHQMYPNQTHTDPGPNWNWAKYYKIINNTYSITATYTTTSGSFYDTGGAGANYQDDERKLWLFTRPNTNNITLSFNSFNVENNYDYMFIYNGGSVNSPLIGQYTGTVNPGPVTSVNDSVLVEFRSDCATNLSGWNAGFIMNGTVVPTSSDNIAPTTIVNSGNNWKTTAFTSNITDADNVGGSGVQKGYYQVLDFDGTEWRANNTKGFFADNFDNAIHPDWTIKTGTWGINGNALVQTAEATPTASNTNIYAALTQSLSNRYLYHFLGKFEGSGVQRRAGFHFFCDQPDSSNRNNSYFVWFRLDDQKVQIYKVVNNNFGVPKVDIPLTFSSGQWYDIKTIYDRTTGVITVYWNNSIIATWTDPSPYTNGNYISFRSANCKFSIDEIKVYRSRSNSVIVNVGPGNANEIRYQNPIPTMFAGKIKSICQDTAGNLSSIYYEDLNIDWTPPTNVPYVNDGKVNDISVINTTDSLSANWAISYDQHSAISQYYYSIGTAPGSTNTLGWTNNWASTAVTAKNLNLTHNTVYYFNVRSDNGAGLTSSITTSNGQKVDTTAAVGIGENFAEGETTVYPNPFTNKINFVLHNSKKSKIQLTLIDIFGREITSVQLKEERGIVKGNLSVAGLQLSNGTYFLKVDIDGIIQYRKLIKE